jgi:hypothetical protein
MSAIFPDPHPGFLLGMPKEEILILGIDIASEKLFCVDAKGKPFITAMQSVEWEWNLVYLEEDENDQFEATLGEREPPVA